MSCEIKIGVDLRDEIIALLGNENIFVITDENVNSLYPFVTDGVNGYVIKAGEDSKTLENLRAISLKMLQVGCNRKTTVIAIGGGVVGDLAGFVSACYMRGTEWINIPTTLLSQVDSSVGGKVAVDLNDYKNVIGAFHLPKRVIISTHFLSTLPDREWLCGVGEIVKTAFLSKKVRDIVLPNLQKLLSRDGKVSLDSICECVAYKEDIVSRDFCENGLRKALNLGHTVGHAIETADKHRLSHGEYVLIGLAIEAFMLKKYEQEISANEIIKAVNACKVSYPEFDEKTVTEIALSDKKNSGDGISVMLARYENTEEVKLTNDEFEKGLKQWKSNR